MFVFVLLCITLCYSSFTIERDCCFTIIVLQMYCYYMYKCFVAIPHGVVGWSALCDCGIS